KPPGFFSFPNRASTFEAAAARKRLVASRQSFAYLKARPLLTTSQCHSRVPTAKPGSISIWAERAQRLELQLARKSPSVQVLNVFEPRRNLKTADAPSAIERFVVANLRRSVKKS